MLVDCNAYGKERTEERTDGFCDPASAKNKTEHIVIEGGQKIEPANADVMEKLAGTAYHKTCRIKRIRQRCCMEAKARCCMEAKAILDTTGWAD